MKELPASPDGQPRYTKTAGFNRSWWRPAFSGDGFDWVSFDVDNAEVARAKILPDSTVGESFVGLTPPPNCYIEIHLLEVREDAHGRGVGRAAVELLAANYPGRQLAAVAPLEKTAGFWAALGWTVYTVGNPKTSPLYISPTC